MKNLAPFRRTISQSVFVIVVGLFIAQFALEAQPVLNLKRLNNLWPNIELFFEVGCNGQPSYSFDQTQNLTLKENGIEITNFVLYKYDPTVRCNVSIGLVLDASSAMSAGNTSDAKFAANYIVNQFDPRHDEGSVVWYNSTAQLKQPVTKDTALLHSSINTLPASGLAAPWDGMYTGLQHIINAGTNPCRAIIVIASGADDAASAHTQQDVIQLAIYNRVRVFTITLGANPNPGFENIALLTGGNYYSSPTPAQLGVIMQSINTMIFSGFNENVIVYQSRCMDGAMREVELTIHDYCNGADSKVKYFRAPKDTSTFMPLDIALGKRKGRGNSEVRVPIDLLTGIPPQSGLAKSAFEIQFDPACVQFKAIETPPGTLLSGIPITVDYTAKGVLLKTAQSALVEGMGTLAEVIFQLSDPDDTTCCDLRLASWIFESGCFRPVLKNGEICIDPRAPIIVCGIESTGKLEWQRSVKDYVPNPFEIRCVMFNQGDKDAKKVMFKIDYDPADIQLISPFSDLQPGTPIDVPIADVSEAAWLVKAKPRLTGDSTNVAITAMFDNHKNVTCYKKIWIPPTGPILQCTASAQKVEADNQGQRYVPMPFQVSVTANNAGGLSTDTVFASIELPPELTLVNPSLQTQRISPAVLAPNQHGASVWMLKHPITVTEKEYVVRIWVKTSNADSSLCETKVTIPPLMAPSLQATCVTPYQLVFDENLGEYTPNPFNVRLQVINASPMLANNVTAFMWLPNNVVLTNPPTQSLTHDFGTLTQYKTGDPVPEKTWTVQYTKKPRLDTKLDFKWSVGGVGPTGIPTDTVNAFCTVEVPGLKPSFECSTSAPDSLGVNLAGTSVEPNPFTYTYTIRNTSKQIAAIQYIEVYYSPGDGIDLEATSPKRAVINKTLYPGKDTSVSWIFKARNRVTRRIAQLQAVAVDDEGNPYTCSDQLPIAGINGLLACELTSSENPIRFDRDKQQYINPYWMLQASLENVGGYVLSNISAEVLIASDPYGIVEFDPAYSGIDANPYAFPVMFISEILNPGWHFRIAKPNTTGVSQYVEFSVTYSSNETPQVVNACNVILEIQPALPPLPPVKRREVPESDSTYSGIFDRPTRGTAPKLVDPAGEAAPLAFSLGQNTPNPFNPSTTIEYSLAEDTRAVLSVYTLLGKQVRVLVSEEQKAGNYRAVFNADGLPSGVYLYKLETPLYTNIKRMVLAK